MILHQPIFEHLELLVEFGQARLHLGTQLGQTAVVVAHRLAHVALLGRLNLDHALGIDLVDLAQPLVTLRLGGGKRLAILLLGAFQLFVAAGRDALALFFERRIDQAAAVRGQGVGSRPAYA